MNLGCTGWVLAGYFVHFLVMYLQCSSPGHHPLPPVMGIFDWKGVNVRPNASIPAMRFSTALATRLLPRILELEKKVT